MSSGLCSACGGLKAARAAAEPLDLPPDEAVRFFRAKGLHAGFSWLDTDNTSHLKSFTVAKAMQLDVLEDIRRAVDRSISEGRTFEQFADDLQPLLVKHGWWGRKPVLDPVTGETRDVQLGSPRRLRIIFDTNIRTAYARGHWERIERVAEARPFLRYVTVDDARVRAAHRPWHGTILRWDHAFWKTHYPPNGWGCRCTVQQLSQDDLDDFGFKVSSAPTPGWDETRPWKNKRTGRIYQVPRGIAPGFQHNVGLIKPQQADSDRLIERIDAAGPPLQRAAIGRPWGTELFRRHAAGQLEGDWPIAVTEGAVAQALDARSRVVRFSNKTARKQIISRNNENLPPDAYKIVQNIIDEGEWFFSARPDLRQIHIEGFVFKEGEYWKLVLREDDGRTYLVTFHSVGRSDRKLRKAKRRQEAIK